MLPLSRLARVGQMVILLKDAKTIIFFTKLLWLDPGGLTTLGTDDRLEE